jgi:integrase/recombinase XerC
MHAAVDGFLRSLRIERNASPLTLKSYAEDFNSFFDYLQDRVGRIPEPSETDISMLRGYVAYLHECQYAKTTIARRLACLRSFFRYCAREKLTTSNPAKALRAPAASCRAF